MVIVIRVPCVPHQRLQDIGPHLVEPGIVAGQQAVVVDMIMEHQSKGPAVPALHDPVEDCVWPREVVEEIQSARHGRCKIEEDVREEDDIGWSSNNPLRPRRIWLYEVTENGLGDILFVPTGENSWLEVFASLVVEVI